MFAAHEKKLLENTKRAEADAKVRVVMANTELSLAKKKLEQATFDREAAEQDLKNVLGPEAPKISERQNTTINRRLGAGVCSPQ